MEKEAKRKREESRESLEALNPFARSRKLIRSPQGKDRDREEEEMEEIREMLVEIKRDTEEIRRESMETRRELENLRKCMKEKEEQWERERNEWEHKVQKIEKKLEEQERKERKKNIVVSGLKMEKERLDGKMENWIEEKLGVKVNVEEAWQVNEGRMVIVKLKEWKQKREVMKNKSRLRQLKERIYLDDDLTKTERETQKRIREVVKEERKKGREAHAGYKKIWIDGEWREWEKWISTKEKN